MSAPFFSIIVPTFNRARMLASALATVRWQDCRDWECFVVDDGSTDATAAVLDACADDARFRLIRSPKNEGMNASRNKALREARGRFVTFLDSDDLWLPGRLSAFRARAERGPDAGFLFSNAWLLRFDRIVGLLFDPARTVPEGPVPGHYAIGDRRLPYVTTNVAIRRDAFERWGLFKTEMKTLDTELFARFLRQGLPVAVLREPLSVRRMHEGQLTVRWEENFSEAMTALAASGADEAQTRQLRAQVACEMAGYLLKGGRPDEVRPFLRRELGPAATARPEWWLSYAPVPLLRGLKSARAAWLRARFHPALAPAEYRAVLARIDPLLKKEA